MKKNYIFILLFILLSKICFSQNLLTNGNLEDWSDDNTPVGWKKAEAVTKSTDKQDGDYSAFVTASKTKDLSQVVENIEPGANYTISFWYKITNGDGTDARIWSVWKNGTTTVYQEGDASNRKNDPLRTNDEYLENSSEWKQHSITVTAPANVDSFVLEVRAYKGSEVYWDNFSFVKESQTSPNLTINSPAQGTNFTSPNVTIDFTVQNFVLTNDTKGNGYLKYTVDGNTPKANYGESSTIELKELSKGTHTITLELVDTNGNSIEPKVIKTLSFSVSTIDQVSTIAELRKGNIGDIYELTGEAIITYTQSYRNQKLIQDTTAGIKIDDSEGILKDINLEVFDGIKNLKGKLTQYKGVLQFVPTETIQGATSSNNEVTPNVLTLADYVENYQAYESQLIKIENVTFIDGGASFVKGTDYSITSNGAISNFRTDFYSADYLTTAIPTESVSIVGIASQRDGTAQITARTSNDIIGGTVVINEPVKIGTITELRNGIKGEKYTLTGEVFVSYVVGNSRNQIYIQDATGGILIDDNSGIIKSELKANDGITNLTGTLGEYNNIMQFVPLENPTEITSNNEVVLEEISLTELYANYETNYESKLVTIKNISFANASGNFEKSTEYIITDNSIAAKQTQVTSSIFYTKFANANYIGKPIPTSAVNLTVLASEYKGNIQVTAIDINGIKSLGLNKNEIEGFSIYPNPADDIISINTKANDEKEITLYNVIGKEILRIKTSEKTIDLSNILSGIYIVKVTENNKTTTQKLIIK